MSSLKWGQYCLVSGLALLLSACALPNKSQPGEADLDTPAAETVASGEETSAVATPVDQAVQDEFQLALAELKAGNPEAAKERFEAMHQAHPELSGPVINLGIIAREAGEVEESKTWFDKALDINPQNTEALNFLGVVARENGDFEAAESYYRRALAIDPDFASAHLNLGILLELYRGRLEEALERYEAYQALQETPDPLVERWIADLRLRTK